MSRSRLDGGTAARRAVVRWTCRLVRRDWRQFAVIMVLVTIGVTATVFLSSAAYNLAPAEGQSEFGDATHFVEYDRNIDEIALAEWLDHAREALGTVDPIGHRTVAVPGSTQNLDYRAQAVDGPFSDPLLDLRSGRAPAVPGEVAITDGVADLLGVEAGDTIDVDGVARRVVGLVENPSDLDDEFVLLAPSELEASDVVQLLAEPDEGATQRFGDAVGSLRVGQRTSVPEDVMAALLMLIVCTVLLALVALVASASFAVIAQRRLPQLGMLSAVGATERHLRLSMIATGVVIGIATALVGAVIGLVTWIALVPVIVPLVGHRIDAENVPWWIAGVAMLLAVFTATAAAWWPARTASRIPTVMALSGRTPRPARGERSAMLAIGLVVAGAVALNLGSDVGPDEGPSATQSLLIVVGTIGVIAGVLMVSPLVIRLVGRLAARLPVAGRLALRDLSRYQARSSAAMAAIGLALGIPAVIVASTAAAQNADPLGNLADNQLLVLPDQFDGPFLPDDARLEALEAGVRELGAYLPSPSVVQLDAVLAPDAGIDPEFGAGIMIGVELRRDDGWERLGNLYAATPELLDVLGVESDVLGTDGVATSETGDDLYLGPLGRERFDPDVREQITETGTLSESYTSLPRGIIEPEAAGVRGWEVVPSGRWLIETSEALDDDQLETARQIAVRHGFVVESRDHDSGLAKVRLASGLAGMLLALGVLAATVGLIRGESADELRTLTATGATRSVRRGITAVTAGSLAALGAVLGIAAAYIGLGAARLDHLTPLPWFDLALIAMGTPLIATLAAWLLAGREPPQIARRPLD
jgi:putative ABC transport system permease protein